jgi:hypothetical protein
MSEAVRVLKVFADLADCPGCGGGGGVYHVSCPLFSSKRGSDPDAVIKRNSVMEKFERGSEKRLCCFVQFPNRKGSGR